MGSPIERFLNAPNEDQQLGLSVKTGVQQPPDTAARVLKLQMRTGLPTDFITRNLDSLEKQAKSEDFDPGTYRQASPQVAQWLAENPNHVSVAAPDLSKLSYLERQINYIKNQFHEGQLSNELQGIGESAILGNVTPEQRARQASIEQELTQPQNFGITGFFEGIPGAIANQLPLFANVFKTKAETALGGAAIGGLAGLITGPGEAATIPGGAIAGWRYGTAIAMARQESALSYLEFEKLRDENGMPLDRSAVLGASLVDGVINGALASVGVEKILKNIPGLRALGRSELRAALASQTTRGAFVSFLKNVGESAGTMGVVNFLQTIVRHGAGQLAEMAQEGKSLSTGQILDRLFSPDVIQQATKAGVTGLQAGAGLGAATAGAALPFDLARASRAQSSAEAFQNIGETVQDAQLMQKLPEKMQEVVHRISQGGAENVYVPTQFWNEYWQSKDVSPSAMAEKVIGNPDAYQEAQRTGGDIAIPLSRFATIIAPTEHLAKFIPELRTDPAEMNQREAQEYVKSLDQQDAEQAKQSEASVGQVQSVVAQQLLSAGFDQSQAESQSKLYASTFRALGQRTGIDPWELFNQYNLKITRNESGNVEPAPAALEQSAYHGSPHLFDQFSLQHIGSGEGAQAYGWGLYFSSKKEIAEWYRNNLTNNRQHFTSISSEDNRAIPDWVANRITAEAFHKAHFPDEQYSPDKATETAIAEFEKRKAEAQANVDAQGPQYWLDEERVANHQRIINALTNLRNSGDYSMQRAGRLFKVEIPDKTTMLDWHATLDKQPENVQDALAMLFPGDVLSTLQDSGIDGKGIYEFLIDTIKQDPDLVLPARVMREMNLVEARREFPNVSAIPDYQLPEAASRALSSQGVTGIRYLGGIHGLGRPENFVVFDDKLVHVQEYEQATEGAPRGRIKIGANEINIELLKNANLSTFLHETGHFFLHVLTDLATRSDVPEAITRDYEALQAAYGDLTAHEGHENFARAFEAYLMEGKAPSAELRGPFARFRSWLVSIYRDIQNLHVQLTPEVRKVFDRLVAGDDEINAAEAEQVMEPLFGDPRAVGMSEAQATRYQEIVSKAHQQAQKEISDRIMESFNAENLKVFQAERDRVRAEVATEANQDPTIRARSILERGKLPDGTDVEGAPKLSETSVRAYWGQETVDSLGRMVARRDGLHPDVAADLFGFDSGDALIQALTNSVPPDAWIERETMSRLMQQFESPMSLAEMQDEAMKAVHNEYRSRVLQRELQILASDKLATVKGLVRALGRRVPPLDAVRAQAESIINSKAVRDLTPRIYQIAEQKSGRLAMEHLLKGDVAAAFDEKQRQLLNHELYRQAIAAQDQISKITSFMSRFDKPATRTRLAKAGHTYLDQIDALFQQYDFRYASNQQITARQSLLEWMQDQQKQGYTPDIPDEILYDAKRTNYRDLPYEKLQSLYGVVKQINHLATLKNQLIAGAKARDFAEVRDGIVQSVRDNHDVSPEPIDFSPGLKDRIKRGARGFVAAHTKMEFLFEWLDGNKEQGPAWENFYKPLVRAENDERILQRAATAKLTEIFKTYPLRERANWFYHKEHFDGIGDLTMANKLALALNMGNDYNKAALMQGYGWNDAQVQKVLDTLTERDWKTVQAIWDHLDSYWPQISALEKKLHGLAPEKVEATPIQTKFGEFRGGYYPIVFDRNLSWWAPRGGTDALDEQARNSWGFKQTLHGHVKERNDTGGKPIKLELTGLTSHINNVIHDLTHREAVIDIRKLINDPEMRQTIVGSMGNEMYRQLNPWLDYVAAGSRPDFANPIEGMLSKARMGGTIVSLGWRTTTALVHALSYTSAIKEIGPTYGVRGLVDTYSKPWKLKQTWDFVTSRSEFMKDRLSTFDRDINDALRRAGAAGLKTGPLSAVSVYTRGLRDSWLQYIGLADMGAALPTWMGAYQKSMDGAVQGLSKGNEFMAIDYADKVVRQTRSTGSAKDLARVQRGSEVYKLFTMFYSPWSTIFNQFAKSTHQFRLDLSTGKAASAAPRYIASMALLWFMPAVMHEAIYGNTPSPDDDQDKWFKWFAKTEFQYPFQSMVLIRDIVNGMTRNGYEPSPAFNAFDKLAKSGQALGQRISGTKEELTRSDISNMAQTVGYATRLPSKQLWLTGEYLYDWWTGETDDNPMTAAWRALVTGKPKEQ